MRLHTDRLVLRELTGADRPGLAAILQDPVAMSAYEGAFDDDEVDAWLRRQRENYAQDGHGLWGVQLADSGAFIGQCGVTWQLVGDASVLEVGYLFARAHWHRGYATEAARACRDIAFAELRADRVYSIVRDTNVASMNVAIRAGMTVRKRFVKHNRGIDMPHLAFAIDRARWEQEHAMPPRP